MFFPTVQASPPAQTKGTLNYWDLPKDSVSSSSHNYWDLPRTASSQTKKIIPREFPGPILSQAQKAALKQHGIIGNQIGLAVQQGHISTVQQFLVNKGYKIAINGVSGPATKAAIAAFYNNVPPAAFNRVHVGKGSKSKVVSSPVQASSGPVGIPDQIPAAAANTKAAIRASRGGNPNVSTSPANSSPWDLATSMANAQYDPAIAALQAQLTGLGKQNNFDQQRIADWFNQMQQQAAAQKAQFATNSNGILNDTTNTMGNVAQLFGGDQAGALAGNASNAAGLIGAVNQSQQDYLQNMIPLLAAQAATQTGNEQNQARIQQGQLSGQIASQQQAKGQALVSDYQQAVQNQRAQIQNAQALQLAQQLAPYQVQKAQADAATAQTQAKYAGQTYQAGAAKAAAQTNYYMARAAAAVRSGHVDLSPGSKDRSTLVKQLKTSLVKPDGSALMGNPIQAQKALFASAVSQGLLTPNGGEVIKGAASLLNSVLAQAYASSPNWRKNFTWNGKTFVKK